MNKSCKYLLALAALASPAFLSAQEVIHRYSFGGNANDGVGSLNGTATTANATTNTEAPLFTASMPTGADTSFAPGSIELGMNKATNIVSSVNFGAPALFDNKASSYSLWFNPAGRTAGFAQELLSNVNATSNQLRILFGGNGKISAAGQNVVSGPFVTTGEATDNAWNHLAVTWDDAAGSGSIGLNGVVESFSFTVGGLGDPARLILGNFATNNGAMSSQFVGEFYDLQIYDGVLSSGDISFLNSNPGVAIPEPSTYGVLLGMLVLGVVAMRRRIAA